MNGKFFQHNWSEMRGQISEWWDELTDEDLDRINGRQEYLIKVLQERYGYTRNLAFVEVKIRMAHYHPQEMQAVNRVSNKNTRGLQRTSPDDEWLETKESQYFWV